MKIQRHLIRYLLPVTFIVCLSCHNPKNIESKKVELRQKAAAINEDFKTIRMEVEKLSFLIGDLYKNQNQILPGINKEKYALSSSGVFYKPVDDGGSAVFVSGYYPVNDSIKRVVYFTEPIDSAFIGLVKKYQEIAQVYYNDEYSCNRIYPFFDVLSQYEAKMNIPGFNFYYLADKEHNPEKKSLWVSEPYVDPAGRGWMVSAIAPVYYNDHLVGVPGIDVTINMITKRYIQENTNSFSLIVDDTGAIVAGQEVVFNLLSFPPLYDHKYIETIKQDTYRKDQYNILLSKDSEVRYVAGEILKNKKDQVDIKLKNENISFISARIPELNWYLLEIIQ